MRATLRSPHFNTLTGEFGGVNFIRGFSEDIKEKDFKFLQAQVCIEASHTEPTIERNLKTEVHIALGGQLELEIKALGGGCTYLWVKDGSTIKCSGSKLSIDNVSFDDAGEYVVVVNNPYGFAISSACTLTVQ